MNGDGTSGQNNPMSTRNPMTGGKTTDPTGNGTGGNADPRAKPPDSSDSKEERIGLRETRRTEAKTEGSNGEALPKYQELIQAYRKNLARPKDSR
jgi:hypothetical protein